jgi:hypothetical protein
MCASTMPLRDTMASPCSVGFLVESVVRATPLALGYRGFWPRKLHLHTNGATSNSRFLPPTHRASQLDEPDRFATRSDTLCRPLVPRRSFHPSTPLAASHPRVCLGDGLATSHRTRTASNTTPLGFALVTAQSAFDWLDSTSAVEVAASAQLNRHTLRSWNTSFTVRQYPALSGRWVLGVLLLPASFIAETTLPSRR